MITRLKLSWPSMALLRPVEVHIGMPAFFSLTSLPYKCVWALHCAMENGDFFFDRLSASELIEKEKIALIAPSLGNAYFLNSSFEAQADFLNELAANLPNLLPISKRREDNGILGISMGGFGAVRWGLVNQGFGHIAAISGVFSCNVPEDERIAQDRRLKAVHGTFKKIMRKYLLEDNLVTRQEADLELLSANIENPPELTMFCGEEDYISLNQTLWLEKILVSAGLPVSLELMPGSHDPQFWHYAFQKAVTAMFKAD